MSDIPERPKVRQDLVFAKRREEGKEITVVKDPVSGRYFSIEEEEHAVVRLLDGTRTIDEVLASLDPDSGIDRYELEDFTRLLDENNFLESNRPLPARARRIEELSLFRIRIRVIDPRGAVDFIARRLGFLVSLPVLFLAGAVVLSAAALSLVQAGALRGGTEALTEPSSLLVFYLIVSVMMTIHEFAHAVVCRRFGGEVREMGFMLLYFIPCFYTDVSDIHLMEKRSRRVAVIAAGPLAELTLWGLFTLGYFFAARGTMLSHVLFIGVLSSGLTPADYTVTTLTDNCTDWWSTGDPFDCGRFTIGDIPTGTVMMLRAEPSGTENPDTISRLFNVDDAGHEVLVLGILVETVNPDPTYGTDACPEGDPAECELSGFVGDATVAWSPEPTCTDCMDLVYFNSSSYSDTSRTSTDPAQSLFFIANVPVAGADDPYTLTVTHSSHTFDNVQFAVEAGTVTYLLIIPTA